MPTIDDVTGSLSPAWPDSAEVAQACADLLSEHRLGRLLDAGGGAGLLTRYLLNRLPTASSALVLDAGAGVLADVPDPIMTRHGRLEDLTGADGEFDTILLRQVSHYLPAPEAALRLLAGRLRAGGVLYVGQIVAPDRDSAQWLGEAAHWISASRCRVWTADQLLVAFAQAGLELRRATLVPHWQPLDDDARDQVGSLPAAIARTMPMRDHQATLYCRLYWLHALLTPEPITADRVHSGRSA